MYILLPSSQYYPIVEVSVRACKNGGIDTKVHGISVIGRVDMNEDEVAANFSFLAMDETTSKDSGLVRKHRSKAEGVVDTHNKVFVWGLNDRGQLGSELPDSKVRSMACCVRYCTLSWPSNFFSIKNLA